MPAELETLAADIRQEANAAEADFRSAVEHAVRAGELLTEAKTHVKHGQWIPWLEANFEFTRQTASAYMRLAARAGELEGTPSISAALRQLAPPKPDAELAALEDVVRDGFQRLTRDLRSLRDGQAPDALGYSSWEEFIAAEFPLPVDWPDDIAAVMRKLLLEPAAP